MVMLAWVAIAAVGIGLLIAWSRFRRQKDTDLGVVTHQWLAEHRLGRWGSDR